MDIGTPSQLAPNPIRLGEFAQPHADLREWIARVDSIGELLRVSGAHWNLELGAVAEMIYRARPGTSPAILFENIPGYPADFSILTGVTNSPQRLALTLGLPLSKQPLEVVRSYRDRMKRHQLIDNVYVKDGTVLLNIDRDDDVDVFKFPAPLLHEDDGGRFIGTCCMVVMRDPDSEWVNVGCYRVQAHDRNTVGLRITPGKHGAVIRDKYFKQGKPCPVVIVCGQDPLLYLAAGNEVAYGVSEFAYAGGHRGIPFDTLKSEVHGLPMPAHAEIVLEGEVIADMLRPEGPFGEWTGYYAGARIDDPAVRVRRVYYRNSPVLTVGAPTRPPFDDSFSKCVMKSAMIWDQIERAGLPGVQGVWCHEAGVGRLFNVVSIKQLYHGHANQAALLVAGAHAGNFANRFVVVVDEDIDPTNLFDVLWAMGTRCDPASHIEIVRRMWTSPLDPLTRGGPELHNSRALIVACRPYEWKDQFPKVVEASPELRAETLKKWGYLLD